MYQSRCENILMYADDSVIDSGVKESHLQFNIYKTALSIYVKDVTAKPL